MAVAKDHVTALIRISRVLPGYFKLLSLTPKQELIVIMNDNSVHEYGKMLTEMPQDVKAMHLLDTSFEFDNRYVTVVSYRHHLLYRQNTANDLQTEPTIPLFYYVHQRKAVEDHELAFFVARREIKKLIGDVFEEKEKILVTDREFKGDNYLPNTDHAYCWIHLQKNVKWHAKTRLKIGEADARIIRQEVFQMFMSTTEER